MVEPPNPYEPSTTTKPNYHMLYYALVVVGTAIVVLALYNLIILRWSSGIPNPRSGPNRIIGPSSNRSLNLSSFKYKKERSTTQDEVGGYYECAVCLSVFEEGEEVRQLPSCKHSFHAHCIDRWLISRMDCPLCRSLVGSAVIQSHLDSEHSREGLLV